MFLIFLTFLNVFYQFFLVFKTFQLICIVCKFFENLFLLFTNSNFFLIFSFLTPKPLKPLLSNFHFIPDDEQIWVRQSPSQQQHASAIIDDPWVYSIELEKRTKNDKSNRRPPLPGKVFGGLEGNLPVLKIRY